MESDASVTNILAAIRESARTMDRLAERAETLAEAARAVVAALRRGAKVLTAGNGGSAAEALHFTEECMGRFRSNRPSLPAVALVADGTALTCIGNDFGWDAVFSRQVEGLGRPGDVLIVFSTSGNASNLLPAVETARERGLTTIAILGRDGGRLAGMADIEVRVDGTATERIQEAHQLVVHVILDAVETAFQEA